MKKPRLGQNYLVDEDIAREIIDHAGTSNDQYVLEIGPGKGILTALLLGKVKSLTALEIDSKLCLALTDRFKGNENFQLIQADALKYNYSALGNQYQVVSNLPYYAATHILKRLIHYRENFTHITVMLQKEVVQRMTATHGSKAFGRLSIMTQYYCHAMPVVEVGPGAFKPAPKVDSAVVRLLPKAIAERAPVPAEVLNRVCLEAFNQRRKTIRNCFSNFATAEQLEQLGLNPGTRPEQLSVEDFIKVAQWLHQQESTA